MDRISTPKRHLLIPNRLFGSFQRHIRYEIDRNIEVMGIGFGKEYGDGKKVRQVLFVSFQKDGCMTKIQKSIL